MGTPRKRNEKGPGRCGPQRSEDTAGAFDIAFWSTHAQ
jgi:hypothetical protein